MAATISKRTAFRQFADFILESPGLDPEIREILVRTKKMTSPTEQDLLNARAMVEKLVNPPPALPAPGKPAPGKPAPGKPAADKAPKPQAWSWWGALLTFVIATHLVSALAFVACHLGVQVACDVLEALKWITLLCVVCMCLVNMGMLLRALVTLWSWLCWLVQSALSGIRWGIDQAIPHAPPPSSSDENDVGQEGQDKDCVRREELCKDVDAPKTPTVAPEVLKAAVVAVVSEVMGKQASQANLKEAGQVKQVSQTEDREQQQRLQTAFDAYNQRMEEMEGRVRQLEHEKTEAKRLQAKAETRLAKLEGRINETAKGLAAHKREALQWKGEADARGAAHAAKLAGLAAVQGQHGIGLFGTFVVLILCQLALMMVLSFYPYTNTPMAQTAAYLRWCKENPGQAARNLAPRLCAGLFIVVNVLFVYGVYYSACLLCITLAVMCMLGFFKAVERESQELENFVLTCATSEPVVNAVAKALQTRVDPDPEDEGEAPAAAPNGPVNPAPKAKARNAKAAGAASIQPAAVATA